MLTAAMLCIASCDGDTPQTRRPGEPTTDSTSHDDTTHHSPNPSDTTSRDTIPTDSTTVPFTLTLTADRLDAYMGQSLQLTAVTNEQATVKWRSTNTIVAIVDQDGLVQMNNVIADGQTQIIATAREVSDTLTLINRSWRVAMLDKDTWKVPDVSKLHPGDTLTLTIVDSSFKPVNDDGFNAAACQWAATSREVDVAQLFSNAISPTASNSWHMQYVIGSQAPTGVSFSVKASYGNAASSLFCTILP